MFLERRQSLWVDRGWFQVLLHEKSEGKSLMQDIRGNKIHTSAHFFKWKCGRDK